MEVAKVGFKHILHKINFDNANYFKRKFDDLDKETRWNIIVKPYKSNRTNEQNSRLWKLYTDIGKHIGITPDETHELMGFKFLRKLKNINGENVEVIKSTTKLNTKQMAEYQASIEQWAAGIGYYFEGLS